MNSPYLSLRGITKTYRDGKHDVAALRGIDLEIGEGQVLGIVGESGCGKSTLGRIAAMMEPPSSGEVYVRGLPIKSLGYTVKRRLRRTMQMVFQDPYSSLNPLMTIEDCIGEGIDIHRMAFGKERKERIAALLVAVGLDPAVMEKRPHEFSGGQRQRIVIARALAVEPEFLVCDEPLAALDVCTQKHILELLIKQKRERHLTCLFISHDIGAVGEIADTIAVMYLGTIVEVGPAAEIIAHPRHPYTKALIGSIPVADPAIERGRQKIVLVGDPPSPLHPPAGCPFHPRCIHATDLCKKERPQLTDTHCACHHV